MVELSHMPERTFKRRFAQATGMAPLDYVHHLRLEEAKQMLETDSMPTVAGAVSVTTRLSGSCEFPVSSFRKPTERHVIG